MSLLPLHTAEDGPEAPEGGVAAGAARGSAPASPRPAFGCSIGVGAPPAPPPGGRGYCAAGLPASHAVSCSLPRAAPAEKCSAADPATEVEKSVAVGPLASVDGAPADGAAPLTSRRCTSSPLVGAAGRLPAGCTASRHASRPPPGPDVGLAPPSKRSHPDWVGEDYVIQRAALAMMAPVWLAVLSARAGELPDPRRALGVIQQMRLALLCAEDAPCEDEVDGTGATLWTQATESSTASLHAAKLAFSDVLMVWPPPIDTVPPTPEIADEKVREWWRRRVRRFLPDAAWARLVRCVSSAAPLLPLGSARSTSIPFPFLCPDARRVRCRPYDILRLDQTAGLLEIFYAAEEKGWSIACDPADGFPALSWSGAVTPVTVGGFLMPRDSARPLPHSASPFLFRRDTRWSPSTDVEVPLPELGILLGPAAMASPSCQA